MKPAAGLLVGALLMTAGCAVPKAATGAQAGTSTTAQAPVISTADAAVNAVASRYPDLLERFSRQPGKTSCQQNIGGPAPGALLAVTCEMRVAQHGSFWAITLIQDYNFNGPHEFTMTFDVNASGAVSQPTLSGDPVPQIP